MQTRKQIGMRCSSSIADVREEPSDTSRLASQLLLHEPVRILEKRDGWARVQTAYNYQGWVREAHLEAGSPDWPPAIRNGNPVDEARRYLGSTYLWGGMSRDGIDCSGLVHMAHRALGIVVPRDAWQQETVGRPVDPADRRTGDLVTFGRDRATHIAFWLGASDLLHATGREGVCRVLEEAAPADLWETRRQFFRFVKRAPGENHG
jgi:cell wall-associated NlpC family hydrolase